MGNALNSQNILETETTTNRLPSAETTDTKEELWIWSNYEHEEFSLCFLDRNSNYKMSLHTQIKQNALLIIFLQFLHLAQESKTVEASVDKNRMVWEVWGDDLQKLSKGPS